MEISVSHINRTSTPSFVFLSGHGTANAVQRTEFLLHKVQVVLTVQEMGRMRKRGDDETLTDRLRNSKPVCCFSVFRKW